MRRRSHLTKAFISDCRKRLVETKAEILNRIDQSRRALATLDSSGDSGDQSLKIIEENEAVSFQSQWRRQLLEVEHALSRIENGTYGTCEETEEPIEPSRLKALPWTRFSLEGAELRDQR